MNPYEVESVIKYGSECPNCGCGIYYSDPDDLFYEITVVQNLYDFVEVLNGHSQWEENTYIIYTDDDNHQCGCSCYFSEHATPLEEVTDNQWTEEYIAMYACGECEHQYHSIHQAKECCKKEEFSEAQLVASLFGRDNTNIRAN
jgi:hypothetical protein